MECGRLARVLLSWVVLAWSSNQSSEGGALSGFADSLLDRQSAARRHHSIEGASIDYRLSELLWSGDGHGWENSFFGDWPFLFFGRLVAF